MRLCRTKADTNSNPAKRQTATARLQDCVPALAPNLPAGAERVQSASCRVTEQLAALRRRYALQTYDSSTDPDRVTVTHPSHAARDYRVGWPRGGQHWHDVRGSDNAGRQA